MKSEFISARLALEVAVKAYCDPRSVIAVVNGTAKRDTLIQKVVDVLFNMNLLKLVHRVESFYSICADDQSRKEPKK